MSSYDSAEVIISSTPVPIIVTDDSIVRADTYTGPGSGVIADGSSFIPKSYALVVLGTGVAASSWNVVLEGSVDGIRFTPLLVHTTNVGDGQLLLSGANLYPVLYFRSRVISLILGSATNIVVTIVGKG